MKNIADEYPGKPEEIRAIFTSEAVKNKMFPTGNHYIAVPKLNTCRRSLPTLMRAVRFYVFVSYLI